LRAVTAFKAARAALMEVAGASVCTGVCAVTAGVLESGGRTERVTAADTAAVGAAAGAEATTGRSEGTGTTGSTGSAADGTRSAELGELGEVDATVLDSSTVTRWAIPSRVFSVVTALSTIICNIAIIVSNRLLIVAMASSTFDMLMFYFYLL